MLVLDVEISCAQHTLVLFPPKCPQSMWRWLVCRWHSYFALSFLPGAWTEGIFCPVGGHGIWRHCFPLPLTGDSSPHLPMSSSTLFTWDVWLRRSFVTYRVASVQNTKHPHKKPRHYVHGLPVGSSPGKWRWHHHITQTAWLWPINS